ncbi:Rieske 2Fe-2S domain-containing protein [Parahaliea mediterranea]|uniref:Rieske 2Fe-2S domain-containing protein n=1 Tax=Parahaliea mediterranea TaxID=651086 RepID=UPI000E2F6AC8|nr:Rieske 2Fe-2S domain-containing protein [Parahaliea mediterranea]
MSRFPFPVPFGWFHVGYADALAVGEVSQVRYFGRDLVLWRDEAGAAHLQDLYCPHLGANLAVGGKVRGELLECPFHHWRFDGSGAVREIDYARRLNDKACLTTYPIKEYYGVLMAWYHPQGEPPLWQLPEIPECADAAWKGPLSRPHRIGTCLQEMAENTADSAHFQTIHQHPGEASYDEFTLEGPAMIMRSRQLFPSSRGPVEGTLNTDSLGFGWSVVRYSTLVDICMVTTNVPIDSETSEQHNHVWYHNPDNDPKIDRIAMAFVEEVNRQLGEDIPIWENKRYLAEPRLCDGDGPIAKFRRWAGQFYAA